MLDLDAIRRELTDPRVVAEGIHPDRVTALIAEVERMHTLRPASEYHEDYGTVLWYCVPVPEGLHGYC